MGAAAIADDGASTVPSRRTLLAVLVGNALEFYDFLTFSFFATQISRCFFPGSTDQDKLLLTLATFGAGFLTRPIGGVVLGRMADQIGRRPVLQLSFALMGLEIVGLALTPSYAAIGTAAPLLVLAFRLLQGFALGGDVGACTAYMVECAPDRQRGLYVSLQFSTQGIAVLGSGLVGSALAATLSPAQLDAWGWRVAFLLGASIVPLGLVLRRGLTETLTKEASADVGALSGYGRVALLGMLLLAFGTIGNYTMNYMATYAQVTLKMSSSAAFAATTVQGLCMVAIPPFSGSLSDRLGRRPVMLTGTLLLLAITLPGYMLLERVPHVIPLLTLTALLGTAHSLAVTPVLAAVTEALPIRIRASGIAIIYAVSITLFGGTTQFVIAWLTGLTGSPIAPAWYLSGAGIVGLAALLALPETAPNRRPLVAAPLAAGA